MNYIGDPQLSGSKTYPKLDELKRFLLLKNIIRKKQMYFRIYPFIIYFDSSLFKMLKDFVPC